MEEKIRLIAQLCLQGVAGAPGKQKQADTMLCGEWLAACCEKDMLGCQRCCAPAAQGSEAFRWLLFPGGWVGWPVGWCLLPCQATSVVDLCLCNLLGFTLICCGLPEPPRRKTLTLMASRSPTPAAAPSESAARRSSQGISRSYICLNPPSAASHSVTGHHFRVAEQLPCH